MAYFSFDQNVKTPAVRIQTLNHTPFKNNGQYVLYWMTSNRRTTWNFALQRACEISNALNKPLLIFEALRVDYPWACTRFHQFVIDGMRNNKQSCQEFDIAYYPYVEPYKGASKGLLSSLCQNAAALISDDFPCFFLPNMQRKVASTININFEVVDSNGIFPLRATERSFTTAASFRRHLQKNIISHLACFPQATPLKYAKKGAHVDPKILEKWPNAEPFLSGSSDLSQLPIAQDIAPTSQIGGQLEAKKRFQIFFNKHICRYHTDRNSIEDSPASGLSPYLHFGHISSHEIVDAVFTKENWSLPETAPKATGSRAGWWGLSPYSEAFLDQIITWRELGYVFTHHNIDTYDKPSSLPNWVHKTIEEHKEDPRPTLYSLEELALSKTHDPIWNAAQTQLRTEGVIHNYLRMLWGKKVYEWSKDADTAIRNLIELNNRYALDGRNPNSYSGIFWVVGRFDRAWGPVRPIFGKLRYMSSESTRRKLKLKSYMKRYSS